MKIIVSIEETHAILIAWAEKNGYDVESITNINEGYELTIKHHNPKQKSTKKKDVNEVDRHGNIE